MAQPTHQNTPLFSPIPLFNPHTTQSYQIHYTAAAYVKIRNFCFCCLKYKEESGLAPPKIYAKKGNQPSYKKIPKAALLK